MLNINSLSGKIFTSIKPQVSKGNAIYIYKCIFKTPSLSPPPPSHTGFDKNNKISEFKADNENLTFHEQNCTFTDMVIQNGHEIHLYMIEYVSLGFLNLETCINKFAAVDVKASRTRNDRVSVPSKKKSLSFYFFFT